MFADVPGGFAVGVAASTVTSVAHGRMLGARGGEGPMPPGLPREVSGSVLLKMAQIDCVVVAGSSTVSPSYISATHQASDPIPIISALCTWPHGTIAAHSVLIAEVN